MLVQLRKGHVVLRPTDEADGELADWLSAHAGQVFRLRAKDGAAMLHTLGPEAEARNEPLNITSRSPGVTETRRRPSAGRCYQDTAIIPRPPPIRTPGRGGGPRKWRGTHPANGGRRVRGVVPGLPRA